MEFWHDLEKKLFDMIFEHEMMISGSSNAQEKYLIRYLVKIHALFSSK